MRSQSQTSHMMVLIKLQQQTWANDCVACMIHFFPCMFIMSVMYFVQFVKIDYFSTHWVFLDDWNSVYILHYKQIFNLTRASCVEKTTCNSLNDFVYEWILHWQEYMYFVTHKNIYVIMPIDPYVQHLIGI